MSMNDQFRELIHFRQVLLQFHEILRDSMTTLEVQYDTVSPFWQDSWRKDYENIWQPLREGLQGYLNREGPAYDVFLEEKIANLGRYLGV